MNNFKPYIPGQPITKQPESTLAPEPAPSLSYPLTLYVAPWQGQPDLPAERMTQQPNGWIVAVFNTPAELHAELNRLTPVEAGE